MFKALLTDVDGTLIVSKPDGLPSARVRKAITDAQSRIHIGVATSRPLFFMKHIFDSVEFSGPCVVSGGTQIYDATTKKVVWNKPLELEDVAKVISILEKEFDRILINEGTKNEDVLYHPGYIPAIPLGIYVECETEENADRLIEIVSDISTVSVHKVGTHAGGKIGIDVTHVQATKQHGVLEVAQLLNIDPKEIIGVGDGYNDFPLLMACGFRVAMGNAVDELKAIADYIAPTVDDDGLADVIEKFVLKQ